MHHIKAAYGQMLFPGDAYVGHSTKKEDHEAGPAHQSAGTADQHQRNPEKNRKDVVISGKTPSKATKKAFANIAGKMHGYAKMSYLINMFNRLDVKSKPHAIDVESKPHAIDVNGDEKDSEEWTDDSGSEAGDDLYQDSI